MRRLWFITNPASGSATPAKCDALTAVFEERGLALAGWTHFPEQTLPTSEELAAAQVDTVVLFAGDGTINAALCRLAEWEGRFLVLPGGTMNLLARRLHGDADPHAIVHAAKAAPVVALPFAAAGERHAFVGMILGPAAQWFRAREAARSGRLRRLIQAMRLAWRRTFGKGVRVGGVPMLRHRYQAVFVTPQTDGLHVGAVDARSWSAIGALGWNWLTGDWIAAQAVTAATAPRLWNRDAALALFDGEPLALAPHTEITAGMTPARFLSTLREDA